MYTEIASNVYLALSENANFIFRNKEVVAFSKTCGLWLRFSEECYKYLLHAINAGLSEEQFISYFKSEDDKLYIKKLINSLRKIEVIVTVEEKQNEKHFKLNSINLMLTNRCNLFCKHCGSASKSDNKEYFDTLGMKCIIDKILRCNPKTLVLTGGEPLIRNDFVELVKHIKETSETNITLMTNATLITPEIATVISKHIASIDISLDGYDEDSCSYIRGKGIFEVVLRNIRLLKEYGSSQISLSMVSLHMNPYEEHKFSELCKELGVTPAFRRLSLAGRAKENVDYLETNSPNPKNHTHINPAPSEDDFRNMLKACNCKAGIDSISIESNGDIVPCTTFLEENMVIGNIKDIDNLEQFLNSDSFKNSEGMKKFIESSPYGDKLCNECEVRHFCWTCPYGAIDHIENRNLFDRYCKNRKKYLFKIIWGDDIE